MEMNPEAEWVESRLSATEVEWQPNLERARRLMVGGRRSNGRSVSRWVAVGALVAGLAGLVIWPGSQAIAQDLWFRLVMNRVAIVRVDLSRLEMKSSISMQGRFDQETPMAEVESIAGFQPYWPASGAPLSVKVTGTVKMSQTVRVDVLRKALAQAGVQDLQVPREWDGVELRSDIGALVIAEYAGDIQLLQTKAAALEVPAGFPLAQFAETAMRAVGMGWWEAKVFGRKFAENPAWLIEIPEDEPTQITEIVLRQGPGMRIEDYREDGSLERASIIYATRQRIYIVSAPTVQAVERMARALD